MRTNLQPLLLPALLLSFLSCCGTGPKDEEAPAAPPAAAAVPPPKTTSPEPPLMAEPRPADPIAYNPLNAAEARVILHKGTERAHTGEYTDHKAAGTYICRQCNTALYESKAKFDSHCGWPSFDDEIEGRVERHVDADGYRIEIVCSNCKGHLGHVFEGEGFTAKNTRHCVNSISMKFVKQGDPLPAPIVLPKGAPKK